MPILFTILVSIYPAKDKFNKAEFACAKVTGTWSRPEEDLTGIIIDGKDYVTIYDSDLELRAEVRKQCGKASTL